MGQVAPVHIILFDQTNFPVALPILQPFLTCDCYLRRCERLHMDEAVHTIFLDEFRAANAAVLLKPCSQVVGDADVERSVAAVGEDVDVVIAGSAMDRRDLARILKPVIMGPGLRRDDGRYRNKLRTL